MVEMAVVTSLVIVPLILGMLEASRVCMVSQLLSNAAREGCRVAVRNGMTSTDVTARVNTTLGGSGIPSGLLTIQLTPASIQTTHLGDAITLKVSVSFNQVSWLPYSYLFPSTTQIAGLATMSSERP